MNTLKNAKMKTHADNKNIGDVFFFSKKEKKKN